MREVAVVEIRRPRGLSRTTTKRIKLRGDLADANLQMLEDETAGPDEFELRRVEFFGPLYQKLSRVRETT
jgi:hypothetical protein